MCFGNFGNQWLEVLAGLSGLTGAGIFLEAWAKRAQNVSMGQERRIFARGETRLLSETKLKDFFFTVLSRTLVMNLIFTFRI